MLTSNRHITKCVRKLPEIAVRRSILLHHHYSHARILLRNSKEATVLVSETPVRSDHALECKKSQFFILQILLLILNYSGKKGILIDRVIKSLASTSDVYPLGCYSTTDFIL
jgi:hypothetical protein